MVVQFLISQNSNEFDEDYLNIKAYSNLNHFNNNRNIYKCLKYHAINMKVLMCNL